MIGFIFFLILVQFCIINYLLDKYNTICKQQQSIASMLVSQSEEFTDFVGKSVDVNKNFLTVVTTHKDSILELQQRVVQAEELLKTTQDDVLVIHNRCVKKGI